LATSRLFACAQKTARVVSRENPVFQNFLASQRSPAIFHERLFLDLHPKILRVTLLDKEMTSNVQTTQSEFVVILFTRMRISGHSQNDTA
jgi:hypothetical protein